VLSHGSSGYGDIVETKKIEKRRKEGRKEGRKEDVLFLFLFPISTF